MNRKTIHRPKRGVCIGDMNQRIVLHDRNITIPESGGADFTETFTSTLEVWALVKTTTGKVFFADTQVDVAVTHEMYIRYDESVTSETWVEFEGNYFDIVAVEDLEEKHDFMRLICAERGAKEKAAAHV